MSDTVCPRTHHRPRALLALGVAASSLLALPALAAPAKAAPPDRCAGIDLARVPKTPWEIGEELSYNLSVAGVYLGKLDLKVGKPRTVGGRPVLTFFGRARTSAFASQVKPFTGRYMSFVDPEHLRPTALRVESTYGEDARWERATFATGGGEVETKFLYRKENGSRAYARREAPLFDLLSVLYYARTRVLAPGAEACQEVYADRRLWRMESQVRGVESVDTAAGRREAYKVEAHFERLPHPDFDPKYPRPKMSFEIYLSTDPSHTPLAFVLKTSEVTGRGELARWSRRGKTTDGDWEL